MSKVVNFVMSHQYVVIKMRQQKAIGRFIDVRRYIKSTFLVY